MDSSLLRQKQLSTLITCPLPTVLSHQGWYHHKVMTTKPNRNKEYDSSLLTLTKSKSITEVTHFPHRYSYIPTKRHLFGYSSRILPTGQCYHPLLVYYYPNSLIYNMRHAKWNLSMYTYGRFIPCRESVCRRQPHATYEQGFRNDLLSFLQNDNPLVDTFSWARRGCPWTVLKKKKCDH